MDNRPIGVFDSGVGGLTAVRRIHEIMPNESIIYFGDTGRVPYGSRSAQTILHYTRQDVAFLRSFDIKAIVVACGTVSSVALNTVSKEQNIPMIGVVEPASLVAMEKTKNGRIGVIGTASTIKSGSYERFLHEHKPELKIFTKACPLFVPLVENGRVNKGDIVIETVVKEYLTELKEQDIDTLILGCTHFPLIKEVISDFMGENVELIDSGAAAADYAKRILTLSDNKNAETKYFVSDDPESFKALSHIFLNGEIAEQVGNVEIATY